MVFFLLIFVQYTVSENRQLISEFPQNHGMLYSYGTLEIIYPNQITGSGKNIFLLTFAL